MRSLWLVPLAVAVAALAACSSGAPVSGKPPVTGTPASTASTSPVVVPPDVSVVLDEQANHTDARVHVGARVEVLLHSDYWMVHGSSEPAVLRQDGPTVQLSGPSCVPGGGCNPVMTLFTALAPGSAVITASRTSCGEALRCVGDQGSFQVTVTVTA
jgi:hypothetical protein